MFLGFLIIAGCAWAARISYVGWFVQHPRFAKFVLVVGVAYAAAEVLFSTLGELHPVRGHMIGIVYSLAVVAGYGLWAAGGHANEEHLRGYDLLAAIVTFIFLVVILAFAFPDKIGAVLSLFSDGSGD